MHSTHEGELPITGVPDQACHVHIVPVLATNTLLSIGQMGDAGCITFDDKTATIDYDNVTVLTGSNHTLHTHLWHINIPTTPTGASTDQPIESAYAIGATTPAQLFMFAHAALFSPALSTLNQALQAGFLLNFPGLSSKLLRKYPP
jgi:hypothetical protein